MTAEDEKDQSKELYTRLHRENLCTLHLSKTCTESLANGVLLLHQSSTTC
uniref:Uncharacterized protein n=1 Tax=Arundo donax TaxID=35708 RepID=A0A0A9BV62_ARUDO